MLLTEDIATSVFVVFQAHAFSSLCHTKRLAIFQINNISLNLTEYETFVLICSYDKIIEAPYCFIFFAYIISFTDAPVPFSLPLVLESGDAMS